MYVSMYVCGPTRFGKALNLVFLKLSSQNMRGFGHATILTPSFYSLPLLCHKYEENRLTDYESRCLRKRD